MLLNLNIELRTHCGVKSRSVKSLSHTHACIQFIHMCMHAHWHAVIFHCCKLWLATVANQFGKWLISWYSFCVVICKLFCYVVNLVKLPNCSPAAILPNVLVFMCRVLLLHYKLCKYYLDICNAVWNLNQKNPQKNMYVMCNVLC